MGGWQLLFAPIYHMCVRVGGTEVPLVNNLPMVLHNKCVYQSSKGKCCTMFQVLQIAVIMLKVQVEDRVVVGVYGKITTNIQKRP
jgi:hypothetical protein